MTFQIKKLNPQDFALAKQLFNFFQIDDGVENPTSASDVYIKNLLEREDFHVIAAIENEAVIGGLTAYELAKYKYETKEMFLYEIAVKTLHRKKGVAGALIEMLKKISLEKASWQNVPQMVNEIKLVTEELFSLLEKEIKNLQPVNGHVTVTDEVSST